MNLRPNASPAVPAADGSVSRETRVHQRQHWPRTPNLLELGFLAVTAGIVGLLDNDRVALFTKLLETADRFHDFGEMAGSRGAILGSEAASQTQTPSHNLSPLLGALGIAVALL